MVSPPRNCSKIVDLISPWTGRPIDSANCVARVPIAFSVGELSILKSRYFSFNWEFDLSANAVAVSWKSSENSVIKAGF
jgi:hypothetical protein